MNIEEAKEILNEAVISEPSIQGYIYISAEDINQAIDILLNALEEKENKITMLNKLLEEQKNTINQRDFTDILLNKVGKKIILRKNNIAENQIWQIFYFTIYYFRN